MVRCTAAAGSFFVGFLAGPAGQRQLVRFTEVLFPGAPRLFLLETALMAVRQWRAGVAGLLGGLIAFGRLMPLLGAWPG